MRFVRVLGLVLLACGAGCSLLFDPDGLAPRVTPTDSAVAAEDLAAPADLAVPADLEMPDLAPEDAALDLEAPDLLSPPDQTPPADLTCVPPIFSGFTGDGGAVEPFDCRRCGCTIDDFTNHGESLATHWNESATAKGWSVTMDGGTLALGGPHPAMANEELDSSGKFYLEGDFDAQVDYHMAAWPRSGGVFLAALGPPIIDGGNLEPALASEIYQTDDGVHTFLFLDWNTSADLVANGAVGTLRIVRTGTTLCAVLGNQQVCRSDAATARVYLVMRAFINSDQCKSDCSGSLGCCSLDVRLSNLRLSTGSIVRSP